MTVTVSTLGFPRIGLRRELKMALEAYWSGRSTLAALQDIAAKLRADAWQQQRAFGCDNVPSNDFSFYDHVLDTSAMLGVVPARYGHQAGDVSVKTYFAMARGTHEAANKEAGKEECGCGHSHATHQAGTVPACEMTKWFDTNYHYLVPEFAADQAFSLSSTKAVDQFLEAKAQGIHTRPVLLGPVTYLKLGKCLDASMRAHTLLHKVLPVYTQVLERLAQAGADWVQIDEPCLVLDLSVAERAALRAAYDVLSKAAPNLKLMLATYFGGLDDNLETALELPVAGLHIDLVRAPAQLDDVIAHARPDLVLSLGVIDGRNIWRADLEAILDRVEPFALGKRVLQLAPSCSLLHVPVDLEQEAQLDLDVKSWLAFAKQKVHELSILARALNEGRDAVRGALAQASEAIALRRTSPKIVNPAVQARMAAVTNAMEKRATAFNQRQNVQRDRLHLPAFPTTTIGSFPQTSEVRHARAAHAKGNLSDAAYEQFLREETERAVRWQEEVGLDVLVHGEFERNDMVQYFGEQLDGFAFTRHGWVQSYGSRCVRPPILFGDVARPTPMTVEWWRYAQSLTSKPMKGMLTGPVTILNWSFVRNDKPRSETCRQIALAIRDEVTDLEKAGAQVIQIDEAALREGLPLRHAEWKAYLDWAVTCFRIASSSVRDETQIHTHMCYSEFNDIIAAIGAMDADVISIETARSRMELLDAFSDYEYPAEIGPGVYDIHAPRVPAIEEMTQLLALAARRLPADRIWVNPDCGLKTRKWDEVRPSVANMVAAANISRLELV